jgi:hypothetical protein
MGTPHRAIFIMRRIMQPKLQNPTPNITDTKVAPQRFN